MEAIVGGFPGAAITILVAETMSEDMEPAIRESVWYDDYVPVMTTLIADHDIHKVYFFGAVDFVTGLAEQLSQFIDENVELVILTDEEQEND